MNKWLMFFCLVIIVFPAIGQEKLPDDQESQAIREIKSKLETMEITLNFSEAPFKEVILFIQTVSDINIIIDPKVEKRMSDQGIKVTLTVGNIKLKSGLNLLLQLHNLGYCFRDKVLFITDMDSRLLKGTPELVIYDVRHLLHVSPDFSAPPHHLPGGVFLPAFPVQEKTKRSIADVIKACIATETWSEEECSIDELGGDLVVVNYPKVHSQVEGLLSDLSHFSSPQIFVELEALEVEDSVLSSQDITQSPVLDKKTLDTLQEALKNGKATGILKVTSQAQSGQVVPLIDGKKNDGWAEGCNLSICTWLRNGKIFVEVLSLVSKSQKSEGTAQKIDFQKVGTSFFMPGNSTAVLGISNVAQGRSMLTLIHINAPGWDGQGKDELAEEEEIPVAQRAVFDKLNSERTSLDFSSTPLPQVIDFFSTTSGINMIIDPEVFKEFPDEEELMVNIKINNLKLISVLNLILSLKNLEYRVNTAGVLIISTKKKFAPAPVLRFYNVADLLMSPHNFPARVKKEIKEDKKQEKEDSCQKPCIVDIIKSNIAEGCWEEKGCIEIFGSTLLIKQTPQVHDQIVSFLKAVRSQQYKQITVQAFLASDKADGYKDRVIFTCINGQRAHIDGGLLEPLAKSEKKLKYAKTGFSLDVTPTIKLNGKELSITVRAINSGVFSSERQTTVTVPVGKTIAVATIMGKDGPLTLYFGACVSD